MHGLAVLVADDRRRRHRFVAVGFDADGGFFDRRREPNREVSLARAYVDRMETAVEGGLAHVGRLECLAIRDELSGLAVGDSELDGKERKKIS